MASVCDRPEWSTLLAFYEPAPAGSWHPNFYREDLEKFLATLTSRDFDELVAIVCERREKHDVLAHEILVALSRRYDARLRQESRSAWERLIIDDQKECRQWEPQRHGPQRHVRQTFETAVQARLPITSGGALLIGPGVVTCDVSFEPRPRPEAADDSSDELVIEIQFTDAAGRVYEVSTIPWVNTLWAWANRGLVPRRFYASQYEPLITGLRSYDDTRYTLIAPGLVAHVSYPNQEFLKHRLYILDVYVGEEWGKSSVLFVIRRHFHHSGIITPPYVLSANMLAQDVLSSDWRKVGDAPWYERGLRSTDTHGEPQNSVRFADS
jgi:hypothetical protein